MKTKTAVLFGMIFSGAIGHSLVGDTENFLHRFKNFSPFLLRHSTSPAIILPTGLEVWNHGAARADPPASADI
jgi:hypothetical protein